MSRKTLSRKTWASLTIGLTDLVRSHCTRGRAVRWLAVVVMLLFAFQATHGAALAQEQNAILDLGKGVLNGVESVESGEEFEFALSYSCSSVNVDCADVVIVDTVPACIEVLDVIATNHVAGWEESGNQVTITFINPLPGGSSGIIRILARFSPGMIPGDPCGDTTEMPVTNEATISGSNAASKDAEADIELEEGDFDMIANKEQLLDEAVVGVPFTFEVQLCSPDDIGGVPLTDPVMIDQLPPGAEFVSATEAGPPADFVYNEANNTVTWNQIPNPWPVGKCYTRQVTMVYNTLPDPPGPITNTVTVTGVPHGCEEGRDPLASYCDPDNPTVVLTDTDSFILELPFGRFGAGKDASSTSSFLHSEAIPGEQIDYTLTISNSGYLTATNVVITDTMPVPIAGHTEGPVVFDQATFGPFSGAPSIAAYYKLRYDPTLYAFPLPGPVYPSTVTVTLDDLGLPPSSDIELFRWETPGLIAPGSSWSAEILATVRITTEVHHWVTNCIEVSGEFIDTNEFPPSLIPFSSDDCAETEIIDARAIPRIRKERLGPPTVDPMGTVAYQITMFNDSAANLDVVGPQVLDLLPIEVDFVPDSQQIVAVNPSTVPVPSTFEVIPNFLNTGRTLLRATWDSDALIPPGGSVTLGYSVVVKEGTAPGPLVNETGLLTNTPPELTLGCTGDQLYTDGQDLDQDGNATETGCRDTAMVTVNVQLSVDTRKYVRGQFETEFSDFGHSPEGGNVDYRIVLTNTSNVSLTNISIVDIFPWEGDRGVIDPLSRGSEFTLTAQLALGEPGVPLTIWFSPSTRPCRGDLVPSLSDPDFDDCEDPQWSLTYPIDPLLGTENPALVRSVRVNVCNDQLNPETPTNCYFLQRNDSFTLLWRMALPAGAAGSEVCYEDPEAEECLVAWNSFGFRASGGGLPFRPSEPPKVGISIVPPVDLTIGDFVWLDVSDIPNDGIQGPDEIGYNGATVLLFNARTMEVLDIAITGSDAQGRPGYYRFLLEDVLPTDHFRIGFEIPPHVMPSPALGGTNRFSDSNGITVTTHPSVAFPIIVTDVLSFTEAITEDLSIDQGYWAPLDFGDAPQGTFGSITYNYPTQITDADPARAARHSVAIFPGLTMVLGKLVDDEPDGEPGLSAMGDDLAMGEFYPNLDPDDPDDEDGVRFPYTLDSPTGPIGILTRGASNSLVITATIDYTIPNQFPYLQAWVDFNRNWDWEYTSNERVIHNRIAVTGTQTVAIAVPATAELGESYARFRLGRRADLEPWGAVAHGEVEDYRVQIVGPPVKSIVATSEAHTPASLEANGNNTSVAIGEIVRYRLTTQLPRGILTNLRITDAIPTGLQYLGNPVVTLTETTPSSITPGILTPTITPASFGSGTDVVFSFGDITNANVGPGVEYLNVEFNALVLNESGNQDTVAASARRNNFTVAFASYSAVSNNVDVLILEPLLTQTKTRVVASPIDAGNVVTWTMTTSAQNGARQTTAFDISIFDALTPGHTLDGPIAITASPGVNFMDGSSPSVINVAVQSLAPGEMVTVTFRTTLDASVEPGQTVSNTVLTTWTSLPGPNGTLSNDTEQSTPGASGSPTGKRDGLTAPTSLNNYAAIATANLVVRNPAFTKLQPPNPWTIGQPLTFTLVITTIEGTTPAVNITDTLPAGLGYTGYRIVTTAADSNGLLAANYAGTFNPPTVNPATPGTPPVGGPVSWNFGDIVNPGDNLSNNDRFLIVIEAVVLNVLSNQHGVTLQNSAAMGYTNAAGARQAINPPAVNVNLIEPTLQIEKSIDYVAPADAGDVLTYTIKVRHASTSTIPAYDTVLLDDFPAELENITVLTATAGITPHVPSFAGNTMRFPADPQTLTLLPDEEITIVYTATIAANVMPRTTFTNTAGVIWATLPDSFEHRRDDGEGIPDGQNLLDSGVVNDYEVNDTATFVVDGSNAFVKLQPDNPWTIGQHLTFTLVITVFEGLSPNVIITDSLPAGLHYVNSTILTTPAQSALITDTFNGTFSNPTPLPPVELPDPFDRDEPSTVTWSFGDITNPGDNDPDNDTFVIQVEVVVLNIQGNQHDVVRQNTARMTHTDGLGELYVLDAGPVNVRIVEPTLQIDKSVDYLSPAEAGDVVTYTVVVRHALTSTIPAYGMVVTDTLPSALENVTYLDTEFSGVGTIAGGATGNVVRVPASDTFDLLPGDIITVTYTAKLSDAGAPGQVITNTAGVIWASLPEGNDERRWDGEGSPDGQNLLDSNALNNYEVNDSAQVVFEARPTFAKLPVDNPWTIGEYITFTLVVTTVEGTLPNVVVTDTLPPGLGFISQRVITSSAQSGGLLTENFAGSFANPPVVIPDPASPPTSTTVVWSFGDIVNPADASDDNETFLIQLVTVVLNILPNQDGVTMQNNAALAYTDGTAARPVLPGGPVQVELVEPVLAVTKAVEYAEPFDAGDPLTYTITLRHVLPTSTIPAYDVLLTDTIPAQLTNVQVVSSIFADGSLAPYELVPAVNPHTLRIPPSGTLTLVPTDAITIVYTAELGVNAELGAPFTNTVGAIWASLPASFDQRRDDRVGSPDTLELLDSGALDDYEVNATVTITPGLSYTITKQLAGTSAPHTSGSDLTIGEVVTYTLRVTFTEGTIPNVLITDNMDAGLTWTGEWALDTTGFAGTVTPMPNVTGTPGASGAPVVFDFGTVVVAGDNLTTTNSFAISLRALVLDVPGNVGFPGEQTSLDNQGTLSAGTLPPEESNVVTIEVVEPRMAITKQITPSVAAPQDIVTVTIVVSNTGLSTAFESRMQDLLPTGLTYAGGASEVAGNGASPAVIITGTQLVASSWLTFPVNTQSVIQFYARLDAGLAPGTVIVNTAVVDNASTLPGDDPNERIEPSANASDDVTVITHDLVLQKSVSSATYRAGEVLTYTLIVTNVGQALAPGVYISDTVPAHTFFASTVNPNWYTAPDFATPCPDGASAGTVCYYGVGDLAPGASATVTFGVTVVEPLPDPAPVILNAACVDDDGTLGEDPTPENNCDDVPSNFVLAQLGDRVWLDRNGNGIQEVTEFGYAGLTIELYRAGAPLVPISTTVSGLLGRYYFTNLEPGDYVVRFVPVFDPRMTLQHQGSDTAIDSDANRLTGRTNTISLSPGEIDNTIDAGVYYLSALGDFVWDDLNADGIQDAGEPGIPDVGVTLLEEGVVISTTTTNLNGYYLFSELDFGSYSVRFAPVPGYFVSPQGAGNDAVDSDIDPTTLETRVIDIEQSIELLDLDAGFYNSSALGDYVWEDMNANGIQEAGEPPIPLVGVQLLRGGSVISTTVTDLGGRYIFDGLDVGEYVIRFTPLPAYRATLANVGGNRELDSDIDPTTRETPSISITVPITDMSYDAGFYRPVTIGDFVWHDHNANGIQDAGEPGLVGVAVTLLYTDGTPVAAVSAAQTVATDASGRYLFTDITPGSYIVQVARPLTMVVSPPLQGSNRDTDSNIDPATNRSGIVSLISNGEDLTIDAGYYMTAALGSYVWMDINVDGIRDPGEPPVGGVTVHLLRAGESTPFLTTFTDNEGHFLFDDLAPGSYQLQFEAPDGLAFTWRDAIDDAMRNSDVNPGTGLTEIFDLAEGVTDLTWGAGLITPTSDPDAPEPDGEAGFQLWLPAVQHQP